MRGPSRRTMRDLTSYARVALVWAGAVLLAGILRLVLTLSGFPDAIVKFVSMSVVIWAATVYFGIWSARHGWSPRDLLVLTYFLTIPYMLIEVAGLTMAMSGRPNIFHAPEYSMGVSLRVHLVGHVIGALTWEPLILWIMSCGIYWFAKRFMTTQEGLHPSG
jgi:hypothetical protein